MGRVTSMSYRLLVRSACDCGRAWAPRGTSAIARFGGCRFYMEMAPAHETHWAGIARKDADVSLSPPYTSGKCTVAGAVAEAASQAIPTGRTEMFMCC